MDRHDFVGVDVDESGLLYQVGSNDQTVLSVFPDQLPAKSGERATDHLDPRALGEIVVGFDGSIRAGQSLECADFFIRDGLRFHRADNACNPRRLKHREAV